MRARSIGWTFLMLLSTLTAVVASRYLQLDPALYFEDQVDVFRDRETTLWLHVAAAMVALLLGPWQFVARIRVRHLRVHRTIGALYVTCCMIGGVAGLALATTAHGGIVSSLGFAGLAIGWLATTLLGLRAILGKRVVQHRRWMIRSFALCFAAVTLRLYLGTFGALEAADLTGSVTFTDAYRAIAWLCWVPNLAIGWWISNRPTRPRSPEPRPRDVVPA